MFFIERKKRFGAWKIVAIAAAVAAVVAAGVAAFMLWQKKLGVQKKIEQEIEAIIEQKFAEQTIEEIEAELAEA